MNRENRKFWANERKNRLKNNTSRGRRGDRSEKGKNGGRHHTNKTNTHITRGMTNVDLRTAIPDPKAWAKLIIKEGDHDRVGNADTREIGE